MKLFSKILCICLCVISSLALVGAMETPAEGPGLKRSFEAAGFASASLATEVDGAPSRKVTTVSLADVSTPVNPDSPLVQLFLEKTRSCLLPGPKMDVNKFVDMLVAVLQRWYTSPEPIPSDCVLVSLHDFIGELLLKQAWRGRGDTSLFVAIQALFYIKEILKKPLVIERRCFGAKNVRGIFFIAFITAYDFLEDEALRIGNRHWAQLLKLVFGSPVYSVKTIQKRKLEFLQLLNWNLHVLPEQMTKFLTEIFVEDHGSAAGSSSGRLVS